MGPLGPYLRNEGVVASDFPKSSRRPKAPRPRPPGRCDARRTTHEQCPMTQRCPIREERRGGECARLLGLRLSSRRATPRGAATRVLRPARDISRSEPRCARLRREARRRPPWRPPAWRGKAPRRIAPEQRLRVGSTLRRPACHSYTPRIEPRGA